MAWHDAHWIHLAQDSVQNLVILLNIKDILFLFIRSSRRTLLCVFFVMKGPAVEATDAPQP
jgi:hypothetical protein